LMPWQRHVADVVLEIDPDTGQLAYQEFGLTVPRQSGKSTLLLAKAVHRASATKFFGGRQKIVYTAQTRKDARQKFDVDYVEDLKATPRLRAVPRMGNGTEHLRFPNGSRFGIEASTEKAGHGQTLDEAYIDEAFAQVDGRLEQAFRPAMITRANKQLGWISTAGWSDASPYLQAKVAKGRAQAEMGIREGLAYFEWSAPDEAPIDDRGVWRLCMPALGHTITEAAIAHELETMENPNDFRRAYLNQWVPKAATAEWSVIPKLAWSARRVQPVRPAGVVAFAVASSWPDAGWTSIAVAGRRDGALLGQVTERREGISWVLDRAVELDRHQHCGFVLDPAGPAGQLVTEFEAKGLTVIRPTAREVAQACGQLFTAVCGDAPYFAHLGQAELDTAVATAQKHHVGDTWRWNRDGTSDPLEAVTLAAWGHATHANQSKAPNLW
jgi:hypothetical protein